MKRLRLSTKTKQALSVFFMGSTVLFFVLLIANKNKLTEIASNSIKTQAGSEIQTSELAFVDSAYNYTKNGFGYDITFLEFGATNCSACKRMETVMSKIRQKYPDRVNVVFINIMKPENHNLMKYYGIAAIPTQVLLDSKGIEFFRHAGFYAAEELEKKF